MSLFKDQKMPKQLLWSWLVLTRQHFLQNLILKWRWWHLFPAKMTLFCVHSMLSYEKISYFFVLILTLESIKVPSKMTRSDLRTTNVRSEAHTPLAVHTNIHKNDVKSMVINFKSIPKQSPSVCNDQFDSSFMTKVTNPKLFIKTWLCKHYNLAL